MFIKPWTMWSCWGQYCMQGNSVTNSHFRTSQIFHLYFSNTMQGTNSSLKISSNFPFSLSHKLPSHPTAILTPGFFSEPFPLPPVWAVFIFLCPLSPVLYQDWLCKVSSLPTTLQALLSLSILGRLSIADAQSITFFWHFFSSLLRRQKGRSSKEPESSHVGWKDSYIRSTKVQNLS